MLNMIFKTNNSEVYSRNNVLLALVDMKMLFSRTLFHGQLSHQCLEALVYTTESKKNNVYLIFCKHAYCNILVIITTQFKPQQCNLC